MTTQPPAKQFVSVSPFATGFFAPIQREFNRLFDELGTGFAAPIGPAASLDMKETDKSVEISVELPGISQSDVTVAIEDNILTISGEKKSEQETKEGDLKVSERTYGAFTRQLSLPRTVDPETLKATMADGVLKISAQKDGRCSAKTIQIEAPKPAAAA